MGYKGGPGFRKEGARVVKCVKKRGASGLGCLGF